VKKVVVNETAQPFLSGIVGSLSQATTPLLGLTVGITSIVILFFFGENIKNIMGDTIYEFIFVPLFLMSLVGASSLFQLIDLIYPNSIWVKAGIYLPYIVIFAYIFIWVVGKK
jgi:Na+-translocating ferredoxin:NAD+ oxidoreductase RnfE subunit